MTTLKELIGEKFIRRDGTATTFDESIAGNNLIGIYFSAHWCGPCKWFTPILKESYEQWMKDGKKISIIFGTLDNDEKSFKDYFSEHGDYLAFEFAEKNGKVRQLMDKYGIRGIPTLLIFDKNGNLITDEGRMQLHNEKAQAINKWLEFEIKETNPKPLSDGYYSIICKHSGKALEIEGGNDNKSEGGKLIQNDINDNGDNQKFFIKYNEKNKQYSIQIKHSSLYLDVCGGSHNNCAEILQWSYHGGKNQHFEIVEIGDNTYRINTHCGKSLDISGSSKENQAKALQYSWHGGNNQRFLFKPIN